MHVTLTLDCAKRLLKILEDRWAPTDERRDLARIIEQAIAAPVAEGRFAGAEVLFEETPADMRAALEK